MTEADRPCFLGRPESAPVILTLMKLADPGPVPTPPGPVADLVERIRPLAPTRLLLFGSRASDRGRPGSDYDIAIIHPRGAAVKADVRRALVGVGVPVDLVVFTPEQWESWIQDPRSMAAEIAREGRVIFDAA